jgi:DNA-binding CsgD family transcriptional regulator
VSRPTSWTWFRSKRSSPLLVGLGAAAFVLLLTIELVTEDEPLRLLDALGDAAQTALLVATAVGAGVLATRLGAQHRDTLDLMRDLAQARAEGEAWRREAHAYVAGLGAAIDEQFARWNLTPAERDVGLLMLKGFSHKEIAALRGTSDATVRHQAKTVYQKAGVPSRTAFCSFFLEDLLPGGAVPGDGSRDDAVSSVVLR